jgi:toxin CcdB
MARFDVHPEPGHRDRLLVDVQADVLDRLVHRMVVPLFPLTSPVTIISRLNPIFIINGKPMVLMTQQLAPIPVKLLRPAVANLDDQFDVIANALDMLFKGF